MSKPHWADHSLPTWGDRADGSFAAQEDAAKDRHHEREADQVFVRDRAAIVAALQSSLRPHKWEDEAQALARVQGYIAAVKKNPDDVLSHLTPLADFAEWYGVDMLERAFYRALTTDQTFSDEVEHA